MTRTQILALYNRFTSLIEKLPKGIREPVLNELVPIRELFLEARPVRILFTGSAGRGMSEILQDLSEGEPPCAGESDNGWRVWSAGSGQALILDARNDVPPSHLPAAIERFRPDVLVAIEGARPPSPEEERSTADRTALCGSDIPRFVLLDSTSPYPESARQSPAPEKAFFLDEKEQLAEAICASLPRPAQLEFARLTGARKAQAHIAGTLLNAFSALCGAIALQPIPLADMPILTTLQTLMVGLIIYTTGRKAGKQLIAEFTTALGLSVGAGFLFREGARALVRIIPIWGNLVSGGIAAAGTYAIGRAAIAYFIEKKSKSESRKIFRRWLPSRRKALPPPPAAG